MPTDSITHSVARKIKHETRNLEYSNIIREHVCTCTRRDGGVDMVVIVKAIVQRHHVCNNVKETIVVEELATGTLPKSPECPSWLRKTLVFSSLQIFVQHHCSPKYYMYVHVFTCNLLTYSRNVIQQVNFCG